MAQVTETPELVDSDSEEELEEEQIPEKEEEDDKASVYSDDSDDCSEEEDREPVEMIKTKPICDKESGKELSQEAGAAPEEVKEPKELEWRLAYAGSETSTEIRHLAPATQYQVRKSVPIIMSSWCQ